ncbi:MAG: DUF948 domain-containing protein [Moorea sp. SIO2B7]|nr:DUF948 domain-containing protein [Moorena sp. SIO2B7]
MIDPLFWLGLSMLLLALSLIVILIAALPALYQLARAARSAEKLFDTLRREFPPTLEAIRLTGLEISELTDDLTEGVNSASEVVKQVDQSLSNAKKQVKNVQVGTRSLVAGVKAAWKTWKRPSKKRRSRECLDASRRKSLNFRERTSNDVTSRSSADQQKSKRQSPSHKSHEAENSNDSLAPKYHSD